MAKELAEHVHHTMTASKPRLVRLQLEKTKITWQRRAAAVTVALQVSEDVTTSLEKLTWTVRYSDHQSNSETRPVPNYPCWISRKNTPSLDKWTLFPGINTNSLTPTGAKPSLDLRNHIFNYFLCIHSIILSNLLYLLSTFIVSLLALLSESI